MSSALGLLGSAGAGAAGSSSGSAGSSAGGSAMKSAGSSAGNTIGSAAASSVMSDGMKNLGLSKSPNAILNYLKPGSSVVTELPMKGQTQQTSALDMMLNKLKENSNSTPSSSDEAARARSQADY